MSERKAHMRLKMIRKELGYTQEEFAEILELSLSGYKKVERGDVNLTIEKLYLLHTRLGLSADYVLFDEETELNDVWAQARKLPDVQKWQMFLRLYAYLSRSTEDERRLELLMNDLEERIKDTFSVDDSGERK